MNAPERIKTDFDRVLIDLEETRELFRLALACPIPPLSSDLLSRFPPAFAAIFVCEDRPKLSEHVTGHFKTSQERSNQNRPL
jgi:hypothetical protein